MKVEKYMKLNDCEIVAKKDKIQRVLYQEKRKLRINWKIINRSLSSLYPPLVK